MTTYFSPEERDMLENQLGLERYDAESEKFWFFGKPGTLRYSLFSGLYMATAGAMYLRARHVGAVTGPSLIALVAGPVCYRWDLSTFRFNNRFEIFTEKNLGHQLELSPITRNAWIQALIENKKYNTALKKRIAELEAEKGSLAQEDQEEEPVEDIDDEDEDEDDDDED